MKRLKLVLFTRLICLQRARLRLADATRSARYVALLERSESLRESLLDAQDIRNALQEQQPAI